MSYEYEVLYVVATRIRFMCPMNYASFPMDAHTCKFQVSNSLIQRNKFALWHFFMCVLRPIFCIGDLFSRLYI